LFGQLLKQQVFVFWGGITNSAQFMGSNAFLVKWSCPQDSLKANFAQPVELRPPAFTLLIAGEALADVRFLLSRGNFCKNEIVIFAENSL
jgi:hypothetical protein